MIVNHIYRWSHEQPGKTALIYNNRQLNCLAFARAIDTTHRFLEAQDLPASTVAVIVSASVLDSRRASHRPSERASIRQTWRSLS